MTENGHPHPGEHHRRGKQTGLDRPGANRRRRRAAAVAAVLLVLGTVAVFMKQNPFANGYQLRVLLSSVSQLKTGSQVRIAGQQVGQVTAIGPGPGDTASATVRIGSSGLPIHADATFTVRPLLILEGSGYLDLHPGSPSAPILRSGATVPISQTSVSVQLDQVLDTLDLPVRTALQGMVQGLAQGLGPVNGGASAGYGGLRAAVQELNSSLAPLTRVTTSLQGTTPGDLAGAIGNLGDTTSQLASNPQTLASLITNTNRVFTILASQSGDLASTVRQLDAFVTAAPPTLRALDSALPATATVTEQLSRSLPAAPATLRATNGLLDQVSDLMQDGQLPQLLGNLAPVTETLPHWEWQLGQLFKLTTPVTDCINSHLVPVLDEKLPDGINSTGDPAWLDGMHAFANFAGAASSTDANGGTERLGVTTNGLAVSGILPGIGAVAGQLTQNVLGVDPTWLGADHNPPFRPDQPCTAQALPNLGARSSGVPSAIRNLTVAHLKVTHSASGTREARWVK